MEIKEIDKIYSIWLELRIIEYLEHLVIDDMDGEYINSDEWQFYPQDVLFLKERQEAVSDKLKGFFM